MKVPCKLVFVLLYVTLIPGLYAQQTYFKNIGTADGIPQAMIYKTIEDSLGYIWLSTSKGVLRYSGTDLKEYGPEDGLTENAFFYASRLPGTNTLFFISNSFQLFVYRNGKFTNIPSKHKLCWLTYDAQNKPLFLTRNGDVVRYENDSLVPYCINEKKEGYVYYHILWLNEHNYILTHATGVEYMTADLRRKSIIDRKECYKYHHITRAFKANNQVLINGLDGLYRFNQESLTADFVFPHKDNTMFCIVGDSATNDIMLANVKGLWIFRKGIIDQQHFEQHLDDKVVLNIFRTSEGVYVFSTYEHGLYLSTLLSTHFGKQNGLAENNIRFLGKDGKALYAFSENTQMYRLNRNKFEVFSAAGQFEQPHKVAFMQSDQQGIRFGLFRNKNKIINIRNRKIVSIEKEPGMPGAQFHIGDSLCFSCGTKDIFNYCPGLNLKYHQYILQHHNLKSSTSNPATIVWHLIDLEKNIYYYIKENGYLVQDYAKPYSPVFINLGSNVEFMLKVNNSLIVAGTNGKGLALIMGDSVAFIGKQQGLSGNRCYKIRRVANQLWVLTDQGLSRLTLSEKNAVTNITGFSASNVLSSDLLTDFCLIGDTVYVASAEGVNAFSRHLSLSTLQPRVNISALNINNIDTAVLASYDLPYDMNNISLLYDYPSLLHAGKVLYKYILLNGNDTVTASITPDKKLQLFSLASGEYTLLLYAMNTNGAWSSLPAQVQFNISPVFWKTWWFITLVSMFVLGIAVVFFQYRNNANILKNKIIDSELKALRLHMNPHFIFNTLNSLQRFVLKNKPLMANEYIAKFSRLIRWVMEYSDKQEVSISEEIEFLNLYIELEQLRFDQAFKYNLSVDPELSIFDTLIPTLVIQPFIENAVKYGLSGKTDGVLIFNFIKRDRFIAVTIQDNGVGREQVKKEQQESGKRSVSTGISYTRERLNLLIRDSQVDPVTITDLYDHNHATGTRVELLIPILT